MRVEDLWFHLSRLSDLLGDSGVVLVLVKSTVVFHDSCIKIGLKLFVEVHGMDMSPYDFKNRSFLGLERWLSGEEP